jgi:hypothetical protein
VFIDEKGGEHEISKKDPRGARVPRPKLLILSSGAGIDLIHIEKIIFRIRSPENLDSQAVDPQLYIHTVVQPRAA